jgi:predicted CoA-substrate-specific enzyme activase
MGPDSTVTAGVDIGSTASKALLMRDQEVISLTIGPSSVNPAKTAETVFREACEKAGVEGDSIDFIIGTGYGRAKVGFANDNVSEVSCHGAGAHFLLPEAQTVVDIGGQDCKAIALEENGTLKNFAMNEKCAAGTGRFLEMMARVLGVGVEDLGALDSQSGTPISISNVCSVFAESEVINLVNDGAHIPDIVRGLHDSLTNRIAVLVNRVGLREAAVITGGVAKNEGVIRALKEKFGVEITPIPDSVDPQIVGALGAALLARRKLEKRNNT